MAPRRIDPISQALTYRAAVVAADYRPSSSSRPSRPWLSITSLAALLVLLVLIPTSQARPSSSPPGSTAVAPTRDALAAFCSVSTSVPLGACSLLSQCGNTATKPYCSTLSLLDALCNYDNPTTDVCTQYQEYCTAKPSKCRADGNTVWPAWTNSTVYQNQIYRMCKVHSMEGCDKCTNPASSLSVPVMQLANCDSFAVYVAMCKSMPDMTMCNAPWKRMCQANPTATKANFPQSCPAAAFEGSITATPTPSAPVAAAITTNSDDASGLPPMRMYFHHDTTDILLFRTWVPRTTGAYVGSCVGVFFLSLASSAFHLVAHRRVLPRMAAQIAATAGTRRELLIAGRAAVVTAQIALSYAAMLVVMSYNVVWCAMLLLGAFSAHVALNRGDDQNARRAEWGPVATQERDKSAVDSRIGLADEQ
ncbi:hypothetical protein AMAG_10675 [Allomyces macrogynus ATCC 38327]|uniref:Copper transport protein n=1 Tax=Allomyces macrogynus (strain ATCC 38327) TaxID=578462 RepID=A0A0L0SRN5_ALLM3|nr:hypothetical protein AMAG_10675 [Allomyces macrogynus ATCC 38327]|eukprot:KNE65009.1 hypothetical protein AMAG_10675 [Allomyces macrogynus ATCC 38327]